MIGESIKNKVIVSFLWKSMERGGVQLTNFIIQIILARLLLPEDYGVIAIIMIFIAISNIFIQSGFGTALVQKTDLKDEDCSTVFYFNLLAAVITYLILFISAPYIASFYRMPILSKVLPLHAMVLILNSLNIVQTSLIQREMNFKKLFYVSLGGIISQGIVGITMAYSNFGVWSLVFGQLANSAIVTILLWKTVKWRPGFIFSFKRLKILFAFSSKLLASSLINTFYNNIYALAIGKKFNGTSLAYYNRGQNVPNLVIENVNGSIQGVLFPAMAAQQQDRDSVKRLLNRSIVLSSFLIFPMMFGLAAVAEPLIIILLGEKWLPSVAFMQLFAIVFSLWPLHTANLQALTALGKSGMFLKLEIIKSLIGITLLIVFLPHGLMAIMCGLVLDSFISTYINTYPIKALLNYSFIQQWRDILPYFFLSILMGAVVYSLNFSMLPMALIFIIQLITGIVIYLGGSYFLKLEGALYIKKVLVALIKNYEGKRLKEKFK